MKYINLRELYPDVYKTDTLVEVTEEVFAVIQASDRAEDAYKRRMYRYKAQYSLDCNNGIEKVVMVQPPTPEEILEDKQLREQLYAAVMALPDKQAKRIYAHFYLGMTPCGDICGEKSTMQILIPCSVRNSLGFAQF